MLKAIIVSCAVIGIMGVPPTPVDELNVAYYLGDYYQIYSNEYSLNQTQPVDAKCSTIQYGLYNGTTVTVDNRYRQMSPTGQLDRTTGRASITATPGVLSVKFDNIPFSFSYRVIKLGPVVMNMYQYAVITDDDMNSLFVIGRNAEDFMDMYDTEVKTFLTAQGFTGVSAPIATYQADDCLYPKSFSAPVPVSDLDFDAYLGTWCQLFTNKNTRDMSQPNSVCVTINYEKYNDTAVNVTNTYYDGSPTGREDITTGMAFLTSTPGVLSVKFDTVPNPNARFSYFITKLGPIKNGKYANAFITDERKFSLFVLSRDCEVDQSEEENILDYLENEGFDGLTNSPLKTYQGEDCKYTSGADIPASSVAVMLLLTIAAALL